MTSRTRMPSTKERENNKRRERRRRAISGKIFSGLRNYGNYKLPRHCDNNEVLKALCNEAGWTVEPDGTTYRKGCKPLEHVGIIGSSTSASPYSSYQPSPSPSPSASFNPSPVSSSFASPTSSSYAANFNNHLEGSSSLIPWLKTLSSTSSSSSSSSLSASKLSHLYIHGGSSSAPVTPPWSSPTTRTPRIVNSNWFLPSSTPPSPNYCHPFGFFKDEPMVTPLQSGTCSPVIPAGFDHTVDVPRAEVISDEFAFGSSSTKRVVKAWVGERVHEDCGSDDLELTLGCSRTR